VNSEIVSQVFLIFAEVLVDPLLQSKFNLRLRAFLIDFLVFLIELVIVLAPFGFAFRRRVQKALDVTAVERVVLGQQRGELVKFRAVDLPQIWCVQVAEVLAPVDTVVVLLQHELDEFNGSHYSLGVLDPGKVDANRVTAVRRGHRHLTGFHRPKLSDLHNWREHLPEFVQIFERLWEIFQCDEELRLDLVATRAGLLVWLEVIYLLVPQSNA